MNLSSSPSKLKYKPNKKPEQKQVSCLAHSLTMKMNAICSSETLVDFQWTTWHYIPEDSIPDNQMMNISLFLWCLKVYSHYEKSS
jgi:hypothetical protein